MSLHGLSACACGHVANHHLRQTGCQHRGCPCERFTAPSAADEEVVLLRRIVKEHQIAMWRQGVEQGELSDRLTEALQAGAAARKSLRWALKHLPEPDMDGNLYASSHDAAVDAAGSDL